MSGEHILSLLGLSLRGGHLEVGEEPVEAVARARDARVLLLAADAADNTRRRTERFAEMGACLWLRLPFTKAELGRSLGRSSVALIAVTDIGLANAVVRRLAELDPVQYGEAADRLDVKAKRAAERRNELLVHEKNLKAGKRRSKAAPAALDSPPPAEEQPPQFRRRSPEDRPRRSAEPGKGPYKPRPAGGKPDGTGGTGRGPYKPRPAGSKPSGTGDGKTPYKSRPPKDKRPKPKAAATSYAHSHPVKKGKGSFRKKEG